MSARLFPVPINILTDQLRLEVRRLERTDEDDIRKRLLFQIDATAREPITCNCGRCLIVENSFKTNTINIHLMLKHNGFIYLFI